MTLESYLLSWGIYLLCSAGLLAMLWSVTAKMRRRSLRIFLRATASVLLLMPYSIGEGYSELAPAIIMLAMESLFEASPQRVGLPVVFVWLAVLLASLGWGAWRSARIKAEQAEQHLHAERDELLEQSRRIEPTLNS